MPHDIPGVLCCGNLVRDIAVGPVGEYGWGRSTWVDFVYEGIGGNGANTAYAIAKLDAPARLIGTAGSDDAGDRVLATLQSAGVDTSFIQRSSLPTPATVAIIRADGARSLLHRLGASSEAFKDRVELTPELIAGCTWFHLGNVFALPLLRPIAADLLARVRQAGLKVAVDTGWDARGEWMNVAGPCLPHIDLLFVNEDEARELTGIRDHVRAAEVLFAHGARTVVVKLGPQGCLIRSAGGLVECPGFQVDVVDTTGAGDCFAGGFLAALQHDLSLRDAARFANAVGALSVQHAGCTTGLLNFKETQAWIEKR